jgi:NAD(P)-dependent dehydrogenase (short-subunit alcohol dehydrogenase family)
MTQLTNKVALISGGGTGIGLAIAEDYLARGAKVVITGRREAPLKALADQFPETVGYVQGDVSESADAARAVEFAVERFGKLDVLVNNAGVFVAKPLVETTDEEIDSTFGVNVVGLLYLTRAAIPRLIESKGSVVNVSSVAGKGVFPGTSVYSATKAAVDHLTKSLAVELGPHGVRVNTVSPGMTVTDMVAGLLEQQEVVDGTIAQTPLGRLGLPVDIAKAAAFLASDDASWVTGQVLAASGGMLL